MLIEPFQKLVKLIDGANSPLTAYCELPLEWREAGDYTITKAWLTVKSNVALTDAQAEIFVTVVGPWTDPNYPLIKSWGKGAKVIFNLPAVQLVPGFYYNLSIKYLTAGGKTRAAFNGFLVSEHGGVDASS